jgi:hypothetical protein
MTAVNLGRIVLPLSQRAALSPWSQANVEDVAAVSSVRPVRVNLPNRGLTPLADRF